MHVHQAHADIQPSGQKAASYPPELELQVAVSCYVGVGTEPESCVRAVTLTSELPLQPMHKHFIKCLYVHGYQRLLLLLLETGSLTEPGAQQCDYSSLCVSSRVLLPLPLMSGDRSQVLVFEW